MFIEDLRKKIVLFTLLIIGLFTTVLSQDLTWMKTYGSIHSDRPYSIQQTIDDGFIMCGSSSQNSSYIIDLWIIKTDENGNEIWDSKINFGGNYAQSFATCIKQTEDGYIVVGDYYNNAPADLFLVKIDENGNEVWNQNFGNGHATSIQVTQDGGYIIAGTKNGATLWLIKTDSSGNEEWNTILGVTTGSSSREAKPKIKLTIDGGYIVSTRYYESGSGNSFDAWLVKLDASGNEEWNSIFGNEQFDEGFDVIQTNDGGYAMICMTNFYYPEWYEFWLIKTDSEGNEEWNQTYGTFESDIPYSLIQSSDGGYVMLGFSGRTDEFSILYSDLIMIKADESGNEVWRQTYGGDGIDYGIEIIDTANNGYLLLGTTSSFGAGNNDFWAIKTDENGSVEIEEDNNSLLDLDYKLNQNYPNPFNPTTTIQFSVSKQQNIKLSIFDIQGIEIDIIIEENISAGQHSIEFDGSKLTSGQYFYKIEGKDFSEIKKMILLK